MNGQVADGGHRARQRIWNASVFSYLVAMATDPGVASIAPTSRRGVRNVCGRIPLSACKTVVEYGPATGVFTMHLLSEMRRPDGAPHTSVGRVRLSDRRLTEC